MIDRYIAPALTFLVLIAGHVVVISSLFTTPAAQPAVNTVVATTNSAPVIVLERVVVTGKRA